MYCMSCDRDGKCFLSVKVKFATNLSNMFIFCHFHSFLLLLISWYFSGGSLWSWISRTKRGAGDTKSDFTFSQQEQGEAAPWKSKNKGRQRLQKSPHTFCLKNLLLLAGQDTIVSGNKHGALIQREARDSKRLWWDLSDPSCVIVLFRMSLWPLFVVIRCQEAFAS